MCSLSEIKCVRELAASLQKHLPHASLQLLELSNKVVLHAVQLAEVGLRPNVRLDQHGVVSTDACEEHGEVCEGEQARCAVCSSQDVSTECGEKCLKGSQKVVSQREKCLKGSEKAVSQREKCPKGKMPEGTRNSKAVTAMPLLSDHGTCVQITYSKFEPSNVNWKQPSLAKSFSMKLEETSMVT